MLDSSRVQEGIFYKRGVRPPGFYMLLLLDWYENEQPDRVRELLGLLWALYDDLKRGRLPDLVPAVVPGGDLRVLMGFGHRAFASGLVRSPPADHRWDHYRFFEPPRRDRPMAGVRPHGRAIFADGDGVSGITYARGVKENVGNAAVAIQFTAETPLAVERAVVETWKLLDDYRFDRRSAPPLAIRAAYAGSQRDDGRSWIDFHDGLSNLKPAERESVIFLGSDSPSSERVGEEWMSGGTSMAFIRLGINLERWRKLGRRRVATAYPSAQEQVVGRTKIGGCPLTMIPNPRSGRPLLVPAVRSGCANGADPTEVFPDPPTEAGTPLPDSHIARTNLLREDPASDPSANRIFRQGYPFFESGPQGRSFGVGINFVSFQRYPGNMMRILVRPPWLGHGGGFGGPFVAHYKPAHASTFIAAYAAGMFFVPPHLPGEAFPGASALPLG